MSFSDRSLEGIQGFIQKPFKKNDLLTEIATVLQKGHRPQRTPNA